MFPFWTASLWIHEQNNQEREILQIYLTSWIKNIFVAKLCESGLSSSPNLQQKNENTAFVFFWKAENIPNN